MLYGEAYDQATTASSDEAPHGSHYSQIRIAR
jgi:hypothetical protein